MAPAAVLCRPMAPAAVLCRMPLRRCHVRAAVAPRALHDDDPPIALLGVTGGTGSSAVAGLVWAGVAPSRLRVITRDPASRRARALAAQWPGLSLAAGDADDDASLAAALEGASGVYVHALAADTGNAEPREVARATRLAALLAQRDGRQPPHVVYNSTAGAHRSRKPPVQARHAVGRLQPGD